MLRSRWIECHGEAVAVTDEAESLNFAPSLVHSALLDMNARMHDGTNWEAHIASGYGRLRRNGHLRWLA